MFLLQPPVAIFLVLSQKSFVGETGGECIDESYAAVPSLARKGTGLLLLLFHKLELVCQ